MLEYVFQETASSRTMKILPEDAMVPLKAALAACEATKETP